MNKITDPKKIKEFVISTIRSGNRERIVKVLQRYYSVVLSKEKKKTNGDIVEEAKRIFGS